VDNIERGQDGFVEGRTYYFIGKVSTYKF